jgi:hypothetical protein
MTPPPPSFFKKYGQKLHICKQTLGKVPKDEMKHYANKTHYSAIKTYVSEMNHASQRRISK